MSDLGQLLKKARTQKGMSLDELQDITKIRKRYLEAIEEGNYKVLPGNFYVRAFIKSYSEAVGLEPDEVMRLFRSVIPETTPEPVIIEPKRRRTTRSSDKASRWTSLLLFIAFPLLILAIIYYYVSNNVTGGDPAAKAPPLTDSVIEEHGQNGEQPVDEPDTSPIEEPDPEPPEPEMELVFVKSEGTTDFYSISNTAEMVVELEIVGDRCWLSVQKDSNKGEYVERSLNLVRGDKREWTFDSSAYFHFGRASAAIVKVNGQEINMGDSANPRKIQLDFTAPEGASNA